MFQWLWDLWSAPDQRAVDQAEERLAAKLIEILREGMEDRPLILEIRVVGQKELKQGR